MQVGMIGLGRMGSYMVQRLLKAGHDCVVHDRHPQSMQELVAAMCYEFGGRNEKAAEKSEAA